MEQVSLRWIVYAWLAVLLTVLEGCGGSGSSTPPPQNSVSYPAPGTWQVNVAIKPLQPTVSGTVTSYSVSPALPAGIALDASTGVISGTPTVIIQASYTVTAAFASGNQTATLMLNITDAAPTVSYSNSRIALAVGSPIMALTPASSGGAVTSWSVTPALPAGLVLDTATGIVSGTPTAAAATTNYTIVATNSGGQSQFTLALSVESGTLVDLGHADAVDVMRTDGTHVVTDDVNGHWTLWNYSSRASLANADSGCTNASCPGRRADVAGATLVVQTSTGLELRSATTGTLTATLPFGIASWMLATDGSYVAAAGPAGLEAWRSDGTVLVNETGDYSHAALFAAPSQLRVASGAKGAQLLELVDAGTGSSTTGITFSGMFQSWFADGGRFITAVNNNVLIWSLALGAQEEAIQLYAAAGVGGSGNIFWGASAVNTLGFYTVGGSTTPTSTVALTSASFITGSGSTVGIVTDQQAVVVDVSGASAVASTHALPTRGNATFAGSDAGHWLTANELGVVLDGSGLPSTPHYLGYGRAMSIAGSTARLVIATASGQMLVYDTGLTAQSPVAAFSSNLHLSSDGTVLAARTDFGTQAAGADYSLKIYALPAGSVTATWPYTLGSGPVPAELDLSADGTVLAQVLTNSRQVSGVLPSSGQIWSDTNGESLSDAGKLPVRPSPDPTVFAAATASYDVYPTGSSLYKNGVLVTALGDWPVGWLDAGHLLTNNYAAPASPPTLGRPAYQGVNIYDAAGTKVGTSALPELLAGFQPLTADTLYSREYNSIFTVSTGAASWASADQRRGVGAVIGNHVVFASGSRVLALTQ